MCLCGGEGGGGGGGKWCLKTGRRISAMMLLQSPARPVVRAKLRWDDKCTRDWSSVILSQPIIAGLQAAPLHKQSQQLQLHYWKVATQIQKKNSMSEQRSKSRKLNALYW